MTQPTLSSLELHFELFGWQVIDSHENLGPLPGTHGRSSIAAMWEIASRWSPPEARMCILFVARGGQLCALEVAVVVGHRTVVRLPDAEVLPIGPDGVDDAQIEGFAANLGRYRGRPSPAAAAVDQQRTA